MRFLKFKNCILCLTSKSPKHFPKFVRKYYPFLIKNRSISLSCVNSMIVTKNILILLNIAMPKPLLKGARSDVRKLRPTGQSCLFIQ